MTTCGARLINSRMRYKFELFVYLRGIQEGSLEFSSDAAQSSSSHSLAARNKADREEAIASAVARYSAVDWNLMSV